MENVCKYLRGFVFYWQETYEYWTCHLSSCGFRVWVLLMN